MKKRFLAALSHAEFMRRYWQKKALLARAALSDYAGAITRENLFELAMQERVESRIVSHERKRWHVRDGPFTRRELRGLPGSGWTLLVQGVDHELPQAARLLREFDFLPYARIDDVMVSYAAPGGGVGPHFDSYDVFLVQGTGKRRWQVSAQTDRAIVPDAPLRILSAFKPRRDWTVSPGDVLYLPPGWCHDGTAITECITYSVGFRTPADHELASRFLDFLQDRIGLDGLYGDPALAPTRHPGRVPRALVQHAARTIARLRWSAGDVAEFTGRYLSEPKPGVVFQRPPRVLPLRVFSRRAHARGIVLAPASRMLYFGALVFMNGEASQPARSAARELARLADARELRPPFALDREGWGLLYEWYVAGYIGLHEAADAA
jgi:50S ribosomal protein L16 3-hydroxylase